MLSKQRGKMALFRYFKINKNKKFIRKVASQILSLKIVAKVSLKTKLLKVIKSLESTNKPAKILILKSHYSWMVSNPNGMSLA